MANVSSEESDRIVQAIGDATAAVEEIRRAVRKLPELTEDVRAALDLLGCELTAAYVDVRDRLVNVPF